jgi:hypothetical protein
VHIVPADRNSVKPSVDPLVKSLAQMAETLEDAGVPLTRELGEMIRLRAGDIAVVPSTAAYELMGEPVTAAEETAAQLLTAIAIRGRDTRLDDDTLGRLLRYATVCAARFDSYLAERTAPV